MRRVTLPVLIFMLSSSTALAQVQWPDKAKNLKVLHQDTTPRRLRGTMLGFARALGVDCDFCHVAEDRSDFSTYDFASDDNPHKNRAREMWTMVQNTNQYLQVAEGDAQVRCMTCHRGYREPKTLGQVLNDALYSEGVDAVVERYHELKERYAGGQAFNFNTDQPLNALGYRMLQSGRVDDSLKFFELNVAEHPEASNPYDGLAEAYMSKGMRWQAIVNYSKSLEIDPSNSNATARLDELMSGVLEPAHTQEN